MGYTTYFDGELHFDRELSENIKVFVNRFSKVRHMKRDVEKIKKTFPDWENHCLDGNLGVEGEFFVGGDALEQFGQMEDDSVINGNRQASTQPGLWCQWIISDEGTLVWDGGEKFYSYVEWLTYLIKNIFAPNKYILNGEISWEGEESDDFGIIQVCDNEVIAKNGIKLNGIDEISKDDFEEEMKRRGYVVEKRELLSIVGYDKDSGTYIELFESYIPEEVDAKFNLLLLDLENESLVNEANGEPLDWIIVEDENHKVIRASYDEIEREWLIPVTWSVYDTITVKSTSLAKAIRWVKENSDDIPLGPNPHYVDGSWQISCDDNQSDEEIAKELGIFQK